MHSPKKKYRVSLNDDSARIIHYGGNELAEAQDLLGKPVAYFFWEFTSASAGGNEEKLLRILGDKEILILLYVGINGGGGSDSKQFTMKQIGNLIHTNFVAKKEYLQAIMCALGVAMTGKDPDALAEEAAEKKTADQEEGEEAAPNPI